MEDNNLEQQNKTETNLKRFRVVAGNQNNGEIVLEQINESSNKNYSKTPENKQNEEQNNENNNKKYHFTSITSDLRKIIKWGTYFWTFALGAWIVGPLVIWGLWWISKQRIEINGIPFVIIRDYTLFFQISAVWMAWPTFIIIRYFFLNKNLKDYSASVEVNREITEIRKRHHIFCLVFWCIFVFPLIIYLLVRFKKVYRTYRENKL